MRVCVTEAARGRVRERERERGEEIQAGGERGRKRRTEKGGKRKKTRQGDLDYWGRWLSRS